MANTFYVRSGATGTANGHEWTDAYLSVNAALNATNTHAGDIIWVSDDHVELHTGVTSLAITTTNTNRTNPTYVICANHASGNIPPNSNTDLAFTANITSQDAAILFQNGALTISGLRFNAGLGNTSGNGGIHFLTTTNIQKFDSCAFQMWGAAVANTPLVIGNSVTVEDEYLFSNSSFLFTQANHSLNLNGAALTFLGCSFQSNTSPMVNFLTQTAGTRVRFRRCDLSQINIQYLGAFPKTVQGSDIRFDECIMPVPTVGLMNGNTSTIYPIQFSACGGQFDQASIDFFGQTTTNNTVYRVGGATNHLGNPKSIQVNPYAAPSLNYPLSAGNPMTRWNSLAQTAVITRIQGNSAVSTFGNDTITVPLATNITFGHGVIITLGNGQQPTTANVSDDAGSTYQYVGTQQVSSNNYSLDMYVLLNATQPSTFSATLPVGQAWVNGLMTVEEFSTPVFGSIDVSANGLNLIETVNGHITVTTPMTTTQNGDLIFVAGNMYNNPSVLAGNGFTIGLTGVGASNTQFTEWKVQTTAGPIAGDVNFANTALLNATVAGMFAIKGAQPSTTLTASVYGMWANNVTPDNSMIWLDVEYYANAISDQTTLSSSGIAGNNEILIPNYSLAQTLPTDTVSRWVGDPFPYSSNNKFVLQTSFTPARPGIVSATVKTTLNSGSNTNTFLFDPIMYLSNSTGGIVGSIAVTYDTGTATITETVSLDQIIAVSSSVAII